MYNLYTSKGSPICCRFIREDGWYLVLGSFNDALSVNCIGQTSYNFSVIITNSTENSMENSVQKITSLYMQHVSWLQKQILQKYPNAILEYFGGEYELDRITICTTLCCYLDVPYKFLSTKVDIVVTIQHKFHCFYCSSSLLLFVKSCWDRVSSISLSYTVCGGFKNSRSYAITTNNTTR